MAMVFDQTCVNFKLLDKRGVGRKYFPEQLDNIGLKMQMKTPGKIIT
jgi:hypothetical protein